MSTSEGLTQTESPHRSALPNIVGSHPAMRALQSQISAVGRRRCTVLIVGETGTGKELVARHIHAAGLRRAGPFVAVDCTTLRDTLFESQLFGHVKGAFTGAERAAIGLIRAAEGGTLFLDEIGEMPLDIQAKLLRCIEENAVLPLGAVEPIPVNVRFIAATHRDLHEMVRQERFREDLFYRLDVVRLNVPPLRERRQDVPMLAEQFLARQAALYDEPVRHLASDALAALQRYSWPGNVRELRNTIERGLVFATQHHIAARDLPASVLQPAATGSTWGRSDHGDGHVMPLATAEQLMISRALRATDGNQSRAAALLGIERHRLARMLRRYDLVALTRSATA